MLSFTSRTLAFISSKHFSSRERQACTVLGVSKKYLSLFRMKTKSVAAVPLKENLSNKSKKNRSRTLSILRKREESNKSVADDSEENSEVVEAQMMDRIYDSQQWESKALSESEAKELNRLLGLDEKYLQSLREEAVEEKKKKKDKPPKRLDFDDDVYAAKVKGFLNLNPFICSGCGANFQSKSPDEPGFLSKEKFKDHHQNAETIRKQQDAMHLLDMAGIEIGSPVAADILRDAKVEPHIIERLQAFSTRRPGSERQEELTSETLSESPKASSLKQHLRKKASLTEVDLVDDMVERSLEKQFQETSRNSKGSVNEIKEEFLITSLEDLQLLRDYRNISRFVSKEPIEESDVMPEICVCQRCFRLQQYGQVEESLRPGWSKNELLSPERFESLLSVIRETNSVVLCIVDVFDLKGSILANLKDIAGKNPIFIAVNKADLLPKDASSSRIIGWVHSEIKAITGLKSPRDNDSDSRDDMSHQREKRKRYGGTDSVTPEFVKRVQVKESEEGILRRSRVHLISCASGRGIQELLASVTSLATQYGNKIYVLGAANVGKSSFINRLLDTETYSGKKLKSQSKKSKNPRTTVSALPGTTLNFLKVSLPGGPDLFDTPGILFRDQLTSRLNPSELKEVIPSRPINAVTLRVMESKCVLIGGLAVVALTRGQPMFFTFFVSNDVKLHPTSTDRADEVLNKHIGTSLVGPPHSAERLSALQPFQTFEFKINGEGWKIAATDIVIAGLGWIAVTGSGPCVITVRVPQGTNVGLRRPLLPYEATRTTARFTGGRLEKKSKKIGKSKGYGWRA